jgi:kynurenine 3-monooxygenase
MAPLKIIVVGAGPVGALAAIYAARRHHTVEIYELRGDLRDPETTPPGFTRSINLAVSDRGLAAIRNIGVESLGPYLESRILENGVPMRGRMIHARGSDGTFVEQGQDYDPVQGNCINAVSRRLLNELLLEALAAMPNVKMFFNHKLTRVDYAKQKAWFDDESSGPVEVGFDLLIGADGAHSKARLNMAGPALMDYAHQYIDARWCEFFMSPSDRDDSPWRMSKHHLHIWPGKDRMFIAIPNPDGSFTCTLFMPIVQYATLEAHPDSVPAFFDEWFPGVTEHIPPDQLVANFCEFPHPPLITIKCSPHHIGSSGVIVGDAAHAMVPFFGQGMNAGLEDVNVLFSILDKYDIQNTEERTRALAEYSSTRVPDAHAINDMALANYVEMRASVLSPAYRLRKRLEELLALYVPRLGWRTKYSRVSFSHERYSDVVLNSERQGRVLERVLAATCWGVALPVAAILLRQSWKMWRQL